MKEGPPNYIRKIGFATIGVGSLVTCLGVVESITYDVSDGLSLSAKGALPIGVGTLAVIVAKEIDPYRKRRDDFQDANFLCGTRMDIPMKEKEDPNIIDGEYRVIE